MKLLHNIIKEVQTAAPRKEYKQTAKTFFFNKPAGIVTRLLTPGIICEKKITTFPYF
ncbi:MAG: hypothetical protein Q9M91_08675 [Candidatus Dojkabacteria bacterium]|nr:hypothetical protein [Candidatus Dojkabacteria bacterium]